MEEDYARSDESDQPQGKTLEQIGAETIGTLLRDTMLKAGISEAVGFEVVLKNGGTHTILSESNPILSTPASEVSSVKIKQSADAG